MTEYTTNDVDLAAWLICRGFELQRLAPNHLTHFVFHKTKELDKAVFSWESGQPALDIDLHKYISVKKRLFKQAKAAK